MRRQAFTLVEVLLVILVLGLIAAFTFPDLAGDVRRRSLTESADRLRSLVVMSHARAMQDGIKYRIAFPGTPDPLDKNADKEIDVPFETLQPDVSRQMDSITNPEWYGGFDAGWKELPVLQEGTRCVAVLPGRPNFDIQPQSPISGPSISEGLAVFVPLTLNPDGTCDWVTFVLTDLPMETTELTTYDVSHILNVIVDGRTGQTWIQRALTTDEVKLLVEKSASPIMHVDFTMPDEITERNILEIHIRQGGSASGGGSGGQSSGGSGGGAQ